jgi:hypothetical protein
VVRVRVGEDRTLDSDLLSHIAKPAYTTRRYSHRNASTGSTFVARHAGM